MPDVEVIIGEVPSIISRLKDRFNLAFGVLTTRFQFLKLIVPVTQVDTLLQVSKVGYDGKDISAAAGTYVVYFTVPEGKRWTLKRVWREGTTAATEVRMTVSRGGTARIFGFNGTATKEDNCDLVMTQGATIGMVTTGNGADTDRYLCIFYDEEDAY